MHPLRFIFGLFFILLLLCYALPFAHAYDNRFPYFTNDRYNWHHAETRTIQLPKQLNLNTASFNQLLTLPDVTEPVALAILEQRPFTNLADLTKLNARLSQKRVDQLKLAIGNRVIIAPAYAGETSPIAKELLKQTVYSKPF
ncbi:MAG: helix-hairpin-helix domain-containing protein [Candidatus Melainabacteria bacterium]|jgi:hypothetical protein|nr:helix-hairpin-helix domain-containing protein [Candidatus Melainabacteria bacterium]